MDAAWIQQLVEAVRDGALSRRAFVRALASVGIAAPLSSQMLLWNGVPSAAAAEADYRPTRAGGGGTLKVLLWQAPTLLNPHFAIGTKDQIASRVFYEPLAGWDADANLVPQLAAEIPSRDNGGLSADGTQVIWRLKRNVTWHDGRPFTADDVVFTWEYATDPGVAAYTVGSYRDIRVERIDDHAVRVVFADPTPFWADAFVGTFGMILPRHHFQEYLGARSREAPANLRPVGTGPYRIVEFRPGDVILGERFAGYHVENQPHFDAIELKGGGDAVSAARAVLQTGEYDYAWNLNVEDQLLQRMEAGGKGRIVSAASGDVEVIVVQTADPWTEVDGERASARTKHPTLSNPRVREALNLLIDRESIQKFIYGRIASATASFVNEPRSFKSERLRYEFSVEKANKLLDEDGWVRGSGGIREKDGRRLKYVFQTSTNAPRQKAQAIIKQACAKAGIELEIKSVTPSVFFSSDAANPDTYGKLYADLEMFNRSQAQPDPGTFLNQCTTAEISSKANNWLGRNISRYSDAEADAAYLAARRELDPAKRAALLIRVNDIFCEAHVVLPLLSMRRVSAAANGLVVRHSGWDVDTWHLAAWYRA